MSDEVCITCGDVAVAMRVVEIGADGLAECVTPEGLRSDVEIGLLEGVSVGDDVLVHACVAIQRLEAV
jgi:hydrogenase expression/formation protein HypC